MMMMLLLYWTGLRCAAAGNNYTETDLKRMNPDGAENQKLPKCRGWKKCCKSYLLSRMDGVCV